MFFCLYFTTWSTKRSSVRSIRLLSEYKAILSCRRLALFCMEKLSMGFLKMFNPFVRRDIFIGEAVLVAAHSLLPVEEHRPARQVQSSGLQCKLYIYLENGYKFKAFRELDQLISSSHESKALFLTQESTLSWCQNERLQFRLSLLHRLVSYPAHLCTISPDNYFVD